MNEVNMENNDSKEEKVNLEEGNGETQNKLENRVDEVVKVKEEEDDTFTVPKKKPIALILGLLILFLVVIFFVVYYFVIDNPKTIFTKGVNNLLTADNKININYDKFNLEYAMSLELDSNNTDYEYLFELINKFTFEGNIGYDKTNKTESLIINSFYDDEDLPKIHIVGDNDTNMLYLSLDELLNKTLKVDVEEYLEDSLTVDYTIEDYTIVINSLLRIVDETLDGAKYTKTYLKLDDQLVKKVTVDIDKNFKETFLTKLINDGSFISSCAKILEISEGELTDSLNEELANLDDSVDVVSLYLGIVDNKFLMLELTSLDDGIKISREDNTYTFEVTEDYTLVLEGEGTINKENDVMNISLVVDFISDDKYTVKLDLMTKIDTNKGIDELDIANAIDVDEITDDDYNEIATNLLENEAILKLLQDTGIYDSLLNFSM